MKKESLLTRLVKLFNFPALQRSSYAAGHTFAASRFAKQIVSEHNVAQGIDWNGVYRDRYNYDREKVYDEALIAWRLNPLARRIVEIQGQYVIDGIDFKCDDEATERFLKDFWNHPLNKIGEHLHEWADELALTGNLFPLITTDSAGMSYLRIHPTDMIAEIETAPNDIQQERSYTAKPSGFARQTPVVDPAPFPNYWASRPRSTSRSTPQATNRQPKTVMLHYSVNKLAGMLWGEPDLAPLLPWLTRYAAWLEDRVRLNRFRQAYLYIVKGNYPSQAEKTARQKEIMDNPPMPGAVLVTDTSEEWDVINPKLASADANNDGLALKKFIAGGRGFPLHWLAEPESSTRTTAEAAGTPTFKGLESRQKFFLSMLKDILTIVVARRAQRAQDVKAGAMITVTAADISERDNAALALAATQVIASFGQLWANGFIDDDEYMRVVYRFAGEELPAARPDQPKAAKPAVGAKPSARPAAGRAGQANPVSDQIKVDAETGDVKIKETK